MKRTSSLLAAALLALSAAPALAQENASLILSPKEIRSVEIELKAAEKPMVRVFFNKSALERVQGVVASNLGQPFDIIVNGKFVAAPRIKEPFKGKTRHLSLLFPDFASAAQAARILVPTP